MGNQNNIPPGGAANLPNSGTIPVNNGNAGNGNVLTQQLQNLGYPANNTQVQQLVSGNTVNSDNTTVNANTGTGKAITINPFVAVLCVLAVVALLVIAIEL